MNYDIVKFLIVDDDQVAVMAVQRSLKKLGLMNPVIVARNGVEALECLRGSIELPAICPPYIILLDLNMPKMGGLEFIEEVRRDEKLRRSVIYVMTTSDAPQDIFRAYEGNVAGYIIKNGSPEEFHRALKMIEGYSQAVVLPT